MKRKPTHNDRLQAIGLDTRTVVRSIWATFVQADEDTIKAGMSWYDEAHTLADWIAGELSLSVDHGAAIIAHLSPRCRWSENVRLARDVTLTGDATGTIHSHVAKARRAMGADDPWTTFGKGPKTWNFARNIVGDLDAVTVDVWASRVAGVSEAQLGRAGVYDAIAHSYRLAAKRAGISPAQMQAITWIVARGKAK